MSLIQRQSQARAELVRVATEMLDGRMNMIDGARKICSLRHEVGDLNNEVFMPIRAIESETDHIPLGEVRRLCDVKYLRRVDDELNRYIEQSSNDILSACEEIVGIYSR